MSVVETLKSLASAADQGQYPASNIRPDLAEAWINGENNVQKRTLQYGESYDFAETVEHDLAGKGMGVERVVRATEHCLTYINQLGDRLSKEPTAAEATEIWDTYDTSLDQYWKLLKTITSKLGDSGIRRHLGVVFKPLFQAHLKAFEVSGEKLVNQVGPKLDPTAKIQKEKPPGYNTFRPAPYYRTTEKLREWTDRTKEYLKAGVAAA